jgi:leucine dehydrogenase
MHSPWDFPDFDDHEIVHFVTDRESGLKAIIAVHSTHLGPGAGRHPAVALSEPGRGDPRCAPPVARHELQECHGRPEAGGGKAVIVADEARSKSPEMFAAFGRAVDGLCGRYVTAEDVGITVADLVLVSKQTRYVSGLPVEAGSVGGDPGPHTSYGVFLGIKAAVRQKLGKESLSGLHIAIQGAGSVAGGVARRAAQEGARISLADIDQGRAQSLADEVGGTVVPSTRS